MHQRGILHPAGDCTPNCRTEQTQAQSRVAKYLFPALCLLLLTCGCYTRDITKNPSSKTDFVVGATYTLKWPSLVRWHDTDAALPSEYPGTTLKIPAPPEQVINPGTRFVVRKIIVTADPETGTFTRVYAEVLDGSFKGRLLDIQWISLQKGSGVVFRDAKYFDEGVPP